MSDLQLKALSSVGIIVTGTTPDTRNSKFWGGNIPFFSPADINDHTFCYSTQRKITELSLNSGRGIPKNSIMITCIGSIGKVALNSESGLTNQQINTLIPYEDFDYKYIYYLISCNVNLLENLAPKTTIPIINKTELGKIRLKFHAYKEQKEIAKILQTIDQTIESTQALIEKYQLIKAGLMHDLFTRGIGADGKLRPPREEAPELYQETAIGWIPKEWEVKSLVDIISFQRGHDIVEAELIEGDYPVISSGGIVGYHNQFTTRGPCITVGRKGTIGKVQIIQNDFWAHDTSLFATNIYDNDIWFVFYLCQLLELARFGTKSGSPSLNRNDIHPLKTMRPPPNEQRVIVMRLKSMEEKLRFLSLDLEKLRKQKAGLMHDLLTGKVQVKVEEAQAVDGL